VGAPRRRVLIRGEATASSAGDYRWTGRPGSLPGEAIDWAQGVISLSGASMTRLPWTRRYKEQIVASRVDATRAVAEAIAGSSNPPAVWVSASAVGYYGRTVPAGTVFDEDSPQGVGFLADTVAAWEAATAVAAGRTRIVLARTGLILARTGVLASLYATTRLGLGARVGPGTQWWPWISLADEIRAIEFALATESLSGPVNLVGPTPASAAEITCGLAAALRRPHALVMPSWLLRAALGTVADEFLVSSQPVRPARLEQAGFTFEDSTANSAIVHALGTGD